MTNIEINVMKQSKFLTNVLSAAVLAGSLIFSTTAYAGLVTIMAMKHRLQLVKRRPAWSWNRNCSKRLAF